MEEVNHNTAKLITEAQQKTTSKERLQELANINDLLAEIVAKNISAPAKLLEKLAFHENKAVRKAVTSNPNTPKNILFILGVDFPRELLNNPIFDFSLLKDLSFIKKIPPGVLSILVQQNNVPSFLLNYAANHPVKIVADTAKMHVSISAEMTKGWHEAVAEIIASSAFINQFIDNFHGVVWDFKVGATVYGDYETPNRSFKLLTNFYELIPTEVLFKSQTFKRNIAKNLKTTPIVLKQLASDEDYYIRWDVAENPSTPAEILQQLAEDSHERVRDGVAGNHNTPIEILESFATDSDLNIRYRVADNPNAPVEILKLLAKDKSLRIRFRVARNPNTPINLLESLANESNHYIREAVAKNANTPLEMLEKLANDSNLVVRESVSENPHCTLKIKKIIFKNFAKSETPSFSRVALFLSHYAASFVLAENSNSISWLERYAIAQNQNTLRDTLEILAQDSNRIVRATAKENLQTL